MGFFSGGGSTQQYDTFSGLRGLGGTAQDMANFLVPSIKSGATYGQNLFTNPSAFLDANGLYRQQSALFPSVVNQIANKMSAGSGARGQLSPENIGSVAGSSATAAAPILLPLIGQNISDLRNTGANIFANLIGTGTNALGSETHGFSRTTAPGVGYNWANAFGNNLFGELGKSLGGGGGTKASGALFG